MDYFIVTIILSSFAMGFWACYFLQRAKRVRIARKAAVTRRINREQL